MKVILLSLVLLGVAGCTERGMYDNLRADRLRECEHQVAAAYDECVAQYPMDFDQYRTARDGVPPAR
ncbi:hypothetical protein S7S_15525 [Isoalcanivorax pacificus W11-5]|uniref:Lipoprotein n=1 Tax=Isoalcanivorax pacificus W11-5 TaxID=391936 RepID=A0A0B4XT89_9GAMM|nr:hypothetical protein [Isoalcanivorax pacificus]AJD49517.1 hypothetical protein S7S_15525 [Isoalcanivorax pacificus W11-5]